MIVFKKQKSSSNLLEKIVFCWGSLFKTLGDCCSKQPSLPPQKKKNETTSTTTAKPTSNETSVLPKALPGICVESWLRWDPTRHLSHDESHAKALSSKQLAQHLRIPREKKNKTKGMETLEFEVRIFSGNTVIVFFVNWGGISMILYVLGARCEVPRENGVI